MRRVRASREFLQNLFQIGNEITIKSCDREYTFTVTDGVEEEDVLMDVAYDYNVGELSLFFKSPYGVDDDPVVTFRDMN